MDLLFHKLSVNILQASYMDFQDICSILNSLAPIQFLLRPFMTRPLLTSWVSLNFSFVESLTLDMLDYLYFPHLMCCFTPLPLYTLFPVPRIFIAYCKAQLLSHLFHCLRYFQSFPDIFFQPESVWVHFYFLAPKPYD